MQNLADYLHGRTDQLPELITVNGDLLQCFQSMWNLSKAGTPSANEVGSPLELSGDGEFKVGKVQHGWSEGITFLTEKVNAPKFVGYYHTHPYPEGYKGIGFSGEDFAAFVRTKRIKILFVQSGDDVFLLVRPDPCPFSLATDQAETNFINEFNRVMNEEYNVIRPTVKDDGCAMALAVYSVNEEYAKHMKIAFYAGFIDKHGNNGTSALVLNQDKSSVLLLKRYS